MVTLFSEIVHNIPHSSLIMCAERMSDQHVFLDMDIGTSHMCQVLPEQVKATSTMQ